MKKIFGFHTQESGLTLLEIVVTFIIAAFLGSMLVEYMGTSLTRGGESVILIQDGFSLNGVMEKITADYENEYLNDNYDFNTLKSNIENGNVVTNTPYYGEYTVQTAYIIFSGGNEAPDSSGDNNILKVTIGSGNQALTTLFRK
jgi:predicted phage tail protein